MRKNRKRNIRIYMIGRNYTQLLLSKKKIFDMYAIMRSLVNNILSSVASRLGDSPTRKTKMRKEIKQI